MEFDVSGVYITTNWKQYVQLPLFLSPFSQKEINKEKKKSKLC